jgi:hypothetical protein
MSEVNDSVPLLQHTNASQERASLHRRCRVSREMTKKRAPPDTQSSDRAHPGHDPSTCYLQDGGVTASGQRVRPLYTKCKVFALPPDAATNALSGDIQRTMNI